MAALGRLLRHYGPETNGVHEALRMAVGQVLLSNGYFRQLGAVFAPERDDRDHPFRRSVSIIGQVPRPLVGVGTLLTGGPYVRFFSVLKARF